MGLNGSTNCVNLHCEVLTWINAHSSLAVLFHSLCLVIVWVFWCERAQSLSLAVLVNSLHSLCIYITNLLFEHERVFTDPSLFTGMNKLQFFSVDINNYMYYHLDWTCPLCLNKLMHSCVIFSLVKCLGWDIT